MMFRPTQPSFVDRKAISRRGTEHHPPSPPESSSSHFGSYATPQRRPSQGDNFLPTIPATPDIQDSGARLRRTGIAGPMNQSGSREFRGASRPQTRWLIVLFPPENLVNELSVGHRSPGKLSSGLLVPLFPTLFAQLAAIAKEFSLPSTTGLCLYLHLTDAPETPRITDDVWPLLWSRHLHTDDASLPLGLPVAGRVQFDIDIPSARWYPMWLAHVSRKELVPDLARAIPTSPRSPRSPRGASSALADTSRAQKVPRPLALVSRQESTPEVQIVSGPSPIPSPSKAVAPPVANKETVEKVRRWSALVTPEPGTLQLSPPAEDLAVVPTDDSNALSTVSTAVEGAEIEPEPLNLEDFQWSVTSAGPSSPVSSCATTASSRVPSIHILERVEGSVILTPTTATSWGPHYDSDVEAELELEPEWRARSPDVGERAEGSVLLTPSTATSWGAPLSYPPTPAQWAAMHELVRSPDMGERVEGSVLLTPSTATSWGAPTSYPPTPAEWHALMDHIIRTPDLGRRAEGSVLLTPSTATTWGPPSAYPDTPAIARSGEWVPSPGLGDREELTPGRIGRMSMVSWSTEVETEEEAYARMGLAWPEGTLLSSVHGEAEEKQDDDEDEGASDDQDESFDDLALVSVQHAVRSVRDSVLIQVTQEVHYDDTASVAGSNDDVESLFDGHTFGQNEPEGAFEFELELESPQIGVVTDEHHDVMIVESSHVQEVHASRGLVVEDYDFEPEATHGRVEIDFGEGLELIPDDASVASDDHVSAASIGGDVFEYAFADSGAEPGFPVSVSASEFPLSPAVDFDSPLVHSFTSEAPTKDTTVAATVITTATITTSSLSTQSLISTRSYGAYPYLVIYPAVYPHLDLYPTAPATNLSRPTLALTTQTHRSPTPSVAESPVDSVRSPGSSRKSSLSIQVPTGRSRSRSIVAVNPADKRSVDWSRSLPPVPPVPRALRGSSVSSIHSFGKKGSGSSLGSVREAHVEEAVVSEERGHAEGEPSVPSRNPRPQPLSTAYPYRYPENLEQLYPSKDTARYPANLERIYPVLGGKGRKTSAGTARSAGVKSSAPNKSLATYSTQKYPVFNLYPAVYPHNLGEIYPSFPRNSVAPIARVATPAPLLSLPVSTPAKPLPLHQIRDVGMSRGYPFIDPYPATYPYNLACLYPSIPKEVVAPKPSSVQIQAPSAPGLASFVPSEPVVLTPALDGYPLNLDNIYPAISGHSKHSSPISSTVAPVLKVKTVVTGSTRLARVYPNFELYRPVYPHNLVIYPVVGIASEPEEVQVQDTVVGNSPVSEEDLGNSQTRVLPKRVKKTHAQLCTEVWRKTHAQLVAEALASRPPKSHAELEAEVFPNGLPEAKFTPEVEPATPTLSVTEAHSQEAKPTTKPALEKLAPVPSPASGPKSAPVPAVAALRRQRSGTIMRSSPTESLSAHPLPQGAGPELGRSRSMVNARTQMFERTHTRSQTDGPQIPPARTLVRQKSATFERAKSLFHTPEETKSEGSQTPPLRSVPVRRVSKLDMSKFGFAQK
ncbi:unnamed protein product [Rhizoctonia solani]|uniref:Uncharacterized protein n=1 Tax=Rhizoctonia solani TaxID=456999 RepID=A0A8H3BEW7_9AGAM|nr:unnamed protein product [Rhizoctonia solani]